LITDTAFFTLHISPPKKELHLCIFLQINGGYFKKFLYLCRVNEKHGVYLNDLYFKGPEERRIRKHTKPFAATGGLTDMNLKSKKQK